MQRRPNPRLAGHLLSLARGPFSHALGFRPHALGLVPLALALLALTLVPGCRAEGELTGEQKRQMLEQHTEIAQQYMHMGELDRAEGQIEKGLAIDPDNVKLKMIHGWTLQKRGRPVDLLAAEKIFRALEPKDDYRATLGLAAALERIGVAYREASEAIRSGRRISEAPDPELQADKLLADARAAWDESATKYQKTLIQHPDDLDALNGLSRVQALLGRFEESLAASEALIHALATDYDFWKQKLLRPEIQEDEEQRYRKLMRQQLELQVSERMHASATLYELERHDEALLHLDAALALDPERPELLSRRAQLHKLLGRYEEALADIRSFLRISTQPFDHPDIKRAWRLQTECEEKLRERRLGEPQAAGTR